MQLCPRHDLDRAVSQGAFLGLQGGIGCADALATLLLNSVQDLGRRVSQDEEQAPGIRPNVEGAVPGTGQESVRVVIYEQIDAGPFKALEAPRQQQLPVLAPWRVEGHETPDLHATRCRGRVNPITRHASEFWPNSGEGIHGR